MFFFLPYQSFWRTQNSTQCGQETLPEVLMSKRDELMALWVPSRAVAAPSAGARRPSRSPHPALAADSQVACASPCGRPSPPAAAAGAMLSPAGSWHCRLLPSPLTSARRASSSCPLHSLQLKQRAGIQLLVGGAQGWHRAGMGTA